MIDDQDRLFALDSNNSERKLYAISQKDGSVLWTKSDINYDSYLSYSENVLYISYSSNITALNPSDGSQIWVYNNNFSSFK